MIPRRTGYTYVNFFHYVTKEIAMVKKQACHLQDIVVDICLPIFNLCNFFSDGDESITIPVQLFLQK